MLAACLLFSAALAMAQNGYLKTSINPGRAGVFVDGKYLGPSANFRVDRKFALTPGEHEVKLVDPRYEDLITKVTITAGKTTVLRENMKALPVPSPPFGTLRTPASGDKFAAVYVNEKYMGHVDEFSNSSQGLLLPPGEYVVKIVPSGGGGAPVEQKVTIQANQTVVVAAR
jgi:hypothetical protein